MDELQPQQTQPEEIQPAAPAPEPAPAPQEEAPAPAAEPVAAEPVAEPVASQQPPPAAPRPESKPAPRGDRPPQERRERPQGERGPRPERQPRQGQGQGQGQGDKPAGSDRGPRQDRPNDRRGAGPREHGKGPIGGGRPSEPPADIDLDKLIADSLYLDNAAHAIVARMRDMDSGTRSQLRRLFSAVRRACRAAETDRQHHFVMLRARLAYTIARHQLRSLDPLERLLLQVTRKNDARGYERFRDLFEAIVAYNE